MKRKSSCFRSRLSQSRSNSSLIFALAVIAWKGDKEASEMGGVLVGVNCPEFDSRSSFSINHIGLPRYL